MRQKQISPKSDSDKLAALLEVSKEAYQTIAGWHLDICSATNFHGHVDEDEYQALSVKLENAIFAADPDYEPQAL